MSSVVMAIDPGASAGWACVDSSVALLAHGGIRTDAHTIAAFVVEKYKEYGSNLVAYIEDQYLGVNPKSMAKIVECRSRFQQELEARDVPVTLIYPQSWQQGLLAGLISIRSPRAQRKKAAQTFVKSFYKIDVKTDEADAICMAVWSTKKRVFEIRGRK